MGGLTMDRRSGVTHALAHCQDCKWESTCYKNAVANAARHATKYRHIVDVEQTISITYLGRSARAMEGEG
jgi:hypothetical protein